MTAPAAPGPILQHASCVGVAGRGLLILGASGAGKSTLALKLIGLGATLVADDQVALRVAEGRLLAAPAPGLEGLIEARGLGLLRLSHLPEVPVALVADLSRAGEGSRLPHPCITSITDVTLPLIPAADRPNVAYEAMAMLRDGATPPLLDPETPIG